MAGRGPSAGGAGESPDGAGTIDFWFDVVCPYAWAASARVPWLEQVTGRTVRWRPILLGGVFRAHGSPDVPAQAMAPARARTIEHDVRRTTAAVGLTASYPPDHPRRTVEAMRLLTAAAPAQVPGLAHDLWHAYWTEGRRLTEHAVLAELAARHEVDVARIDAPDVKDALRAHTDEAVAHGVFGVPTFTVDGHRAWGADRMDVLAHQLGADVRPRLPAGPVEVFHDFSSPYAYLGVMAMLRRDGGTEGLTLTPMLLGALFRGIGTPMVPVATFVEAKQRWVREDLAEQAAWRGLPFRFTSHFPLRTVTALRVALIEPAATAALYRGAWVDDIDLGEPGALRELLDGAGLDGSGLIEGTRDPGVKERLKANTDRAMALGVPGAPTFLADGELYWGQDRLGVLADRRGPAGVGRP